MGIWNNLLGRGGRKQQGVWGASPQEVANRAEGAKWMTGGEYDQKMRENARDFAAEQAASERASVGAAKPSAGNGIWGGPVSRYAGPSMSADTAIAAGGQAAADHAKALSKHRTGSIFGYGNRAADLRVANRASGFGVSRPIGRRADALAMARDHEKTALEIEKAKGMWGEKQANTQGMWNLRGTKAKEKGETARAGINATAQQNVATTQANAKMYGDDKALEGVHANAAAQQAIATTQANAKMYGDDKLLDAERIRGIYANETARTTGAYNVAAAGAKNAAAGEAAIAEAEAKSRPQSLFSGGAVNGNLYRVDENGRFVDRTGKPVDVDYKDLRKVGKDVFSDLLGPDAVAGLHNRQFVAGLANVGGRWVLRTAKSADEAAAAGMVTDPNEIALYDAALAAFLLNDTPPPKEREDSISAQ